MAELFDARIVVGPLERIEDVDDGACTLLGYTRPELLRLHGTQIVPLEDHPAAAVSVDRMRRGEMTRVSGSVLHKDGSLIAVEIRAVPLPNGRLEFRIRRSGAEGETP